MIPAAAYYRMSSDEQRDSVRGQREEVAPWAPKNGYRIIREYIDEGRPGWKDSREDFQRLISDAQRGEFKAVVCFDQDRFSRFPVLEANHYWFMLDRAGVHIATVNQGKLDFASLAGWLTASIAQHGKAELGRDIARNAGRELRKRRLDGKWVGPPPLGYVIGENGHLSPADDDSILLVRRIFTLRAQGFGYRSIAKQLNDEGIPTTGQRKWAVPGVRHLLQRDAYIGHSVIGKNSRAKYQRLTDGPVSVENAHEPIIDRELWDAVRSIDAGNAGRRGHWKRSSEGGALAGLLFCHCGSAMYHRRDGRVERYVCSEYARRLGCGFCGVESGVMLRIVGEKIRQDVLLGSKAKLLEKIKQELAAGIEDTGAVKRRLAALDSKIDVATERLLVVDASLVPSLERKLLDLRGQRESLAESFVPTPAPNAKEIADSLWQIQEVIATSPPAEVRSALSTIVERIDVEFEHWRTTAGGRRRFRPTGGTICMTSKSYSSWWRTLAFRNRSIPLTAADFAA